MDPGTSCVDLNGWGAFGVCSTKTIPLFAGVDPTDVLSFGEMT